jgi:3'-phosphoadenosine 5'-phosphosulfate sulfotransferase (PAPS reductase)/FAD synthetase
MKRYLSWSGGKDSTASIILCYENGIEIDGIIFSEVMFDHSRNISGENPEHIDFIYNKAIPKIEKEFGYKVVILRAEQDYVTLFNRVIKNSKKNNGKIWGFPLGGMCYCNNYLKVGNMKKWKKKISEPYEDIVGIAFDEKQRFLRLKENHPNSRSVLYDYQINENDTYEICRKYDLLSPIYEYRSRGGCWFCPNQSIEQFAYLRKNHPELYRELEILSKTPNQVKGFFAYNKTLEEITQTIEQMNKIEQLSVFD